MRRVGGGTIAALLWLGLVVGSAPGQTMIDKPDDQGSWWSNLFGARPKSEPKKPAPAARPATTTADRAFQRERLSNIYLRRQAVCDRLRDIALQTNNTALQEEANRLDELAWKLFTEQTNRLGAAGSIDRADQDDGETPPPSKPAGRYRPGSRNDPDGGDSSASTREDKR